MSVRFHVDYSSRQVGCKLCKNKIEKDLIRMGRRCGEGAVSYFHPACLFATFPKAKATTKTAQVLGDIEGHGSLSDADQQAVSQLLDDWNLIRAQQQLMRAGNYTAPVPIHNQQQQRKADNTAPAPNHNQEQQRKVCNMIAPAPTHNQQHPALQQQRKAVNITFPTPAHTQLQHHKTATSTLSNPVQSNLSKPAAGGHLAGPIVVVDDDSEVSDEDDDDPPGSKRRRTGEWGIDSDQRQQDRSSSEECCVCLELPVHPVSLPCSHTYCYLCAKGLVRTTESVAPLCSLCRQPFPLNYLDSAEVLTKARRDVEQVLEAEEAGYSNRLWQWFYQDRRRSQWLGRRRRPGSQRLGLKEKRRSQHRMWNRRQGKTGWWRFEERNSSELEKSYLAGQQTLETLICGSLYTIDFVTMEQYQKNCPTRRRRIKRDLLSSDCRGVAGLHSAKRTNQ